MLVAENKKKRKSLDKTSQQRSADTRIRRKTSIEKEIRRISFSDTDTFGQELVLRKRKRLPKERLHIEI